jgi:hypothetical protein
MSFLATARGLGLFMNAAFRGCSSTEGWNRYVPMNLSEGEREFSVKALLLNEQIGAEERYDRLFQYFLRGFVEYASSGFERVFYPGMGSVLGYRISGLEGFARTAPLLAAWIFSGRNKAPIDPVTHERVDLVAILRKGLLAGTDPASPAYWGKIKNYDVRIVEAADISRVLWLTREQIWTEFSVAEQNQVAAWLLEVNKTATPTNNWLLFPVIVNFTLDALGYVNVAQTVPYNPSGYYEFKNDYLENGWFFDRPEGVDYYNAWGITYDIFWIHLLYPNFDRSFILKVLDQSASLTAHLIGPKGIPIMGRSIGYRTAIPVPVIARSFIDQAVAAQGMARRSMDVVWRYFVAHGCLRNGTLTQGYFDSDPRFVDRYSGPGSYHWGLRSLVLAFMHRPESQFWAAPEQPLPIEVTDYRLDLPKLGWIIEGCKETGGIAIRIPNNKPARISPVSHTRFRQIGEKILRRPLRPYNHALKYECYEYTSENPLNLTPAR